MEGLGTTLYILFVAGLVVYVIKSWIEEIDDDFK